LFAGIQTAAAVDAEVRTEPQIDVARIDWSLPAAGNCKRGAQAVSLKQGGEIAVPMVTTEA
jgi:hypothetical protein